MPIFSGPTKIAFGFGLGVMATSLIKEILPNFRGLGRPLLKASVKSGMMLARDSRLKLAQLREIVDDVAAEAEAELRHASAEPPVEPRPQAPRQTAGVM